MHNLSISKRLAAAVIAASVIMSLVCGCAAKSNEQPVSTPIPDVTSDILSENSSVPTQDASSHTSSETMQQEESQNISDTVSTTAEPQTTAAEQETTSPVSVETQEPSTVQQPEEDSTAIQTLAIEPMEKELWAKASVNVRSGPGTSYERLGHLDGGDKVDVTGIADNGWYRIVYKGKEGFVGGSYLTDKKPEIVTTAATSAEVPAEDKKEDDKMQEQKNEIWIATWGTAMLTPGTEQIPKTNLSNTTMRQQIRVSVGGNKLRLVLSNEYGKTDLEIKEITITYMNHPKSYKAKLDDIKNLTYDSKKSFKVPAGKRVTTDVLDFEFDPLEDLCISITFGNVPSTLTCHTASRCQTWITKGSHAADNEFENNEEMTSWYFITELDTMASKDSSVIVCLGDSLTDGASVTTGGFARYTDELARQLQADDNLKNIGVVNMGIGATALYSYGGDIAGTNRANRDVLKIPGVKYCILFMGVNDIGGAQSDISDNIIKEYKSIIERCHKNGIKVYGCTLTPFKGNSYYSTLHENIRKSVNKFVVSKDSGFDGFIDLSSAVASASDPEKMDSKYVSVWNDYLHFNDSGYKFVGKTVFSHIKKFIEAE